MPDLHEMVPIDFGEIGLVLVLRPVVLIIPLRQV